MKYEIHNATRRQRALQCVSGRELIDAGMTRVLEFEKPLEQRLIAGLLVGGGAVDEVPDDTPVTPYTPRGAVTAAEPEPEPTDEEKMAALKEQADTLGVTYSKNIKLETLTDRVNEAIADAEKRDAAVEKAKGLGIEVKDTDKTADIEKAIAEKESAA